MTHLDEATVVTLRDGESVDERTVEHLGGCATCTEEVGESERRSQLIVEVLGTLDEPVDVLRAKAAVRRRLDARREEVRSRRAWWRGHLGRAAAILVLTAGAASALPWSPVGQWWEEEQAGPTSATGPVGAAPQAAPPATGISVAVPQGRIAVILTGAQPGTVIEVEWVEGATARVSAPTGSGFTYAAGRAEVEAAGGPVEVELPRDATFASLEVDGRVFLERSADGLAVPGPAVETSEAGIRFVVPAL